MLGGELFGEIMKKTDVRASIYRHFLGTRKNENLKNNRCQVCHEFFEIQSENDQLCRRCKNHGTYYFLQNLHLDPSVRE